MLFLCATVMDQKDHHAPAGRRLLGSVCSIVILSSLYLLSRRHYLLFHSIVEIATVAVAFAIFLIFWNSRRFVQNGYMLFLGIAYLFVGAFDLVHTLSYKGMGVFAGRGADLPTQLWIAARYLESLSFLVAPLFLRRRLRITWTFLFYGMISCLLLASIFSWKVFPVCFDDLQNRLTPFKEVSEFVIIGILLASAIILFKQRKAFDARVWRWFGCSIVLTMFAELMFTRYTDPYEWTNALGHLLKLLSFYAVYKALIEKEAYLRTVVSNAPVILFATDTQGGMTVLEGKGLATMKQKHDVRIGTNIFERYRDFPDFLRQMRRVLEGHDVACEVEFVSGRTFEVRCSPLRGQRDEIAGIMGVALDITDAKKAEARILANQKQLRALTTQLLSVEDQERRSIATELHDSVGQILAFIKIEMGELRRAELPPNLTQTVNHIREQVNEAIQQTRTLTFEISPPELYTLGLESALEELTQRFSQERQIECTVEDSQDPKPLTDQMKTLLYRSVRELLVNAAKHARASRVHVTVERVDDDIRIAVEDNGIGFDTSRLQDHSPHRTAGFGLFSIRERLTHMGGGMYIQSDHEKGTKVVLWAPLENGGSH